ncbi:MAG: hypothetical protein DWB45_09095 [Xanthomonadales bacterium]|nr:hypothetical protein [Xanthomonadales bacterium]MCC6596789.1 hypothetical protein [Rhodanobacteraceae bacterium]MDL1869859.1 hypothetical protein [Gammaproteobacteria bacterium PRO6]
MLRWILLALGLLCTVVVFTTKSALALGLALLVGLIAFIGFVLTLAGDRVSSVSRPDTSMASPEQLAAMTSRRTPVTPPAPAEREPRA